MTYPSVTVQQALDTFRDIQNVLIFTLLFFFLRKKNISNSECLIVHTVWLYPFFYKILISSVQSLSHVRLFVNSWTAAHQAPCPSPTPRVCSKSCSLSRWCHPAISSSVFPFSLCLQSFPESRSFPMSQFFTSGGQSIGVSASASVLPKNILHHNWIDYTIHSTKFNSPAI